MKKIILSWNKYYIEIFRQTGLLSQLFSFIVALILTLDFTSLIYNISSQNEISLEIRQAVIKELFIKIFIALLFAARFFLLFSRDKIYFWLSQFVWLFTYLTLLSQLAAPEFSGCTKNAFPMFGENFAYVFVTYLIVSPLKQLTLVLISLSKMFVK